MLGITSQLFSSNMHMHTRQLSTILGVYLRRAFSPGRSSSVHPAVYLIGFLHPCAMSQARLPVAGSGTADMRRDGGSLSCCCKVTGPKR
jgi:hypothetical protein